MAEFTTASYVITVVVMFVLLIVMWAVLKDRKDSTKKTVLLVLAWLNFALHFLKILLPKYYGNWPYSLFNLSFDNLCSVNTMLLPFAMLSKKQGFKDCVFMMSFVGGLGAVFYAHDMFNATIYIVEGFRYYFCHYCLFLLPLVALLIHVYKPSFKSFWKLPLFVLFEMAIIFFNNAWLSEIGLLKMRVNLTDRDYVNSAFVYGPYFYRNEEVLGFIDIFVPKFFKTIPEGFTYYDTLRGFYDNGGLTHYWPVAWAICPLIVYVYPLSFLIYMGLDFKGFKQFFRIKNRS